MVRKRWQHTSGIARERGNSQRQLRVGEELRHALSKILRRGECRDPSLEDASIAITEVKISSDLRSATVFFMSLAGANAAEILAGLKRGTPFLKRLVARELPLRYAPDLIFELDVSFDRAERIAALLGKRDAECDPRARAPSAENPDDVG